MSAWIVSRAHIDVLVQGLAESEIVTEVDPDELGRTLWGECVASVAYRYPDDNDGERPGYLERDAEVEEYVYRRPTRPVGRDALHAAVACYQYQSCEHPDWRSSQAYAWTTTLRESLNRAGHTTLDPWGFDEPDVHAA